MSSDPKNGSTYDLPVPRRPGIDDVEYLPKSNAADLPPPDPRTGLAAEEFQTSADLLIAANKVIPVLVLSLSYTSTYALEEFTAAGDNLVTGNFTVTKVTVGWCKITWPANSLPTFAAEPFPAINGTSPAMIAAHLITNGVEVHIDSGAGSADRPFSVAVY